MKRTVSHLVFFLVLWKRESFMYPLLLFTNPLWQFLVRSGLNGPKLSFTESLVRLKIRWWQLLFRESFTNPRCSLLICDVIYQSAGVNYCSAEKIKMLKTDPKKANYEEKNVRFTIPLISYIYLLYSAFLIKSVPKNFDA